MFWRLQYRPFNSHYPCFAVHVAPLNHFDSCKHSTMPMPFRRIVLLLVILGSRGDSTWGKYLFSSAVSLNPRFESSDVLEFSSVSVQMKTMNSDFTISRGSGIYYWFNLMISSDIPVLTEAWNFFLLSIFISYMIFICGLWLLSYPCSPWPVSGHQQTPLLQFGATESHLPTRWKGFIFPYG